MAERLDIESQAEDRQAGDAIYNVEREPRNWKNTPKQGRIAQAALIDPSFTIGQIAEQADASQYYVAAVLEHASHADLVDMVLAYHGYEIEQELDYAYDTGQWDRVDEMYEQIFPDILADATG